MHSARWTAGCVKLRSIIAVVLRNCTQLQQANQSESHYFKQPGIGIINPILCNGFLIWLLIGFHPIRIHVKKLSFINISYLWYNVIVGTNIICGLPYVSWSRYELSVSKRYIFILFLSTFDQVDKNPMNGYLLWNRWKARLLSSSLDISITLEHGVPFENYVVESLVLKALDVQFNWL